MANGDYDETTAVLCSRTAGESRGLHLIRAAVNDRQDNRTTFHLIRLPARKKRGPVGTLLIKAAEFAWDKLGSKVMAQVLKGLVGAGIFGYSYLAGRYQLSGWQSAVYVAAPVTAVLLFLIQGRFHAWLAHYRFGGHWEYHLSKDNDDRTPLNQEPGLKRMVIIEKHHGVLRFRGWKVRPAGTSRLFNTEYVLVSDLLQDQGVLNYWYVNDKSVPKGEEFSGVVNLDWGCKYPFVRTDFLMGWFGGRRTRELGVIRYRRISREEFEKVVGDAART